MNRREAIGTILASSALPLVGKVTAVPMTATMVLSQGTANKIVLYDFQQQMIDGYMRVLATQLGKTESLMAQLDDVIN